MTVKQLINELEKIENKYLEVECQIDEYYFNCQIDHITRINKKIIIFAKDGND